MQAHQRPSALCSRLKIDGDGLVVRQLYGAWEAIENRACAAGRSSPYFASCPGAQPHTNR